MTPRDLLLGVLTLAWIAAVVLPYEVRRRWLRARIKYRGRLRRLPCRVCPCRPQRRPPSPAPRYDEVYRRGVAALGDIEPEASEPGLPLDGPALTS